MDLDAFYCKTTFYVRPERTLVVATVGRRVGGPGSSLWGSGWALGVDRGLLDSLALQDVPWTLMAQFVAGNDMRVLSTDAKQAWMRTWRHKA
jgi:hypothetical protein